MECWTQNDCRTPRDGKSKGRDKQTDDFQATFPNFMTLTDEERHAFFQTLYAAKVKLESSGVTLTPFFGTVHDQSWDSDALGSAQDDGHISRGFKISAQYNFSSGSFAPAESINSTRSESSEKVLKEDESSGELSRGNLEEILGRNASLESLGFDEKEVEVTSFNGIFENMEIPKTNPVISSLSYEILNKESGASSNERRREETLKIKEAKLKVQVTLTSGDNERIKRVSNKPEKARTAFTRGKTSPAENNKKRWEDVKSAEEIIDDHEIKDLLIVERESEEEKKSQFQLICKRSSEGEKKALRSENDSDEIEGEKIEVEDQLTFKKEIDEGKTLQERSETKIFMGKGKAKKRRNDKKIEKSNSKGSIEYDTETMQESILAMTTVKKGTESNTKVGKQEAEVAIKNRAIKEAERQKRVEKLNKCLQKRELAYQNMMKRKDEIKAQRKEKSARLKNENTKQEEVKIEKNSEPTNLESEQDVQSTSEKKNLVVACTEERKGEKENAEVEIVKRSDTVQVSNVAGAVRGSETTQIGRAAGTVAGSDPVLIGHLAEAVAGSDPVLIGRAAGTVAGSDPVLIGHLAETVAGSDPVLIGRAAGTVAGSDPVLIGHLAEAVAGSDPVLIGRAAGTVAGSDPVLIGHLAGTVAGSDPVLIGRAVGTVAGSDAVLIGHIAGTVAGSDPAQIGRTAGTVAGSDPAQISHIAETVAGSETTEIGRAAGTVTGSDPVVIGHIAEAVAGSNPVQIGHATKAVAGPDVEQIRYATGAIENSKKEKASELIKGNLECKKECASPMKAKKVVFVYDNVIEKIRNAVLDLEKHVKGEDAAENECLVLLFDYVDYLTTAMATLCEEQVKKQHEENRFDEENLKEIQEILRVSTTTTEDELEFNQRLEIRKKRKKSSFIKRLGKYFKIKKNQNSGSSSSSSSR